MANASVIGSHQWKPLEALGLTHPFFHLEGDTILFSWVALAIILVLAVMGRIGLLHYPQSMLGYCTKRYVRSFMDMVEQARTSDEVQRNRFIAFFTTLFTWLLICNCLIVFPFMEEPTKDINTTLALSILTFLYIQYAAVIEHGLLAHLNEFFKTPLAVRGVYQPGNILSMASVIMRVILNTVIGIILLPIELMSKLSSIISLSFRLFGNIFAGSVISGLWLYARSGSWLKQIVGMPLTIVITFFFGLFEGAIQAFVFTMLSMSYLSRALEDHT